jgi:hypothetical protein
VSLLPLLLLLLVLMVPLPQEVAQQEAVPLEFQLAEPVLVPVLTAF